LTDSESPWYQSFFEEDYLKVYGPVLDEETTGREVAFIGHVLDLSPGDRVLDLCCGHGRHTIGLSQNGYLVTGQDLNSALLSQARRRADEWGLQVQFVHSDMRTIPFSSHFDAVINVFSSFGYLESEEEDARVLRAVANALKKEGRFLADMINREWVISNYVRDELREMPNGLSCQEHREIDLATSRNHITFTITDSDGNRHHSVGHHIRLYTLTEIIRMLEHSGLELADVYGGFDGSHYSVTTRRMIIVARKCD
jgi:SAM-dependent methyltransferase